jgi:hypothetical protein
VKDTFLQFGVGIQLVQHVMLLVIVRRQNDEDDDALNGLMLSNHLTSARVCRVSAGQN